jgi:hypothetical protein
MSIYDVTVQGPKKTYRIYAPSEGDAVEQACTDYLKGLDESQDEVEVIDVDSIPFAQAAAEANEP